ncbi:hypothetical protein H6P81_015954 [Aristolochia fimbriata]|uniref:Uncharacterized protein n=1 Tax=Aristolochia fimbriata TaxID=158543 RepID=A0AAV7E7L5_ARIFI|nr:hypothetical protein H6P81_015954 [Aristolochia fimbriata]
MQHQSTVKASGIWTSFRNLAAKFSKTMPSESWKGLPNVAHLVRDQPPPLQTDGKTEELSVVNAKHKHQEQACRHQTCKIREQAKLGSHKENVKDHRNSRSSNKNYVKGLGLNQVHENSTPRKEHENQRKKLQVQRYKQIRGTSNSTIESTIEDIEKVSKDRTNPEDGTNKPPFPKNKQELD